MEEYRPGTDRDTTRWHLLLIVAVTLIVNGNTLWNGFVYDDFHQVLDNSWITNFRNLPDIFVNDATHAKIKGLSNYYRPMMNVVYMMSYYLFGGLRAWGFHLVNVLCHLGVTVLVYFTSASLFPRVDSAQPKAKVGVPLVAGLLFASHPIHAETVAWVACVPELTFTLFCLLSLRYWIRSRSSFDRKHYWSLVYFAIAIFCKETAVTLLPLLLLYDYLTGREKLDLGRIAVRYAPFVAIVALYTALRFIALGGIAPTAKHPELTTFEVIINILPLFMQYLGKLLVPMNQNAFYVLHPVHSILDFTFLLSLATLLAFIALGFHLYKRERMAFWASMLLLVPLLPVFYIRGVGENTFAERYLYFPSIGFAMICGYLATELNDKRESWKLPVTAFLLSLLAIFSGQTVLRNMVWQSDLSLWTDTARKSPDSDHAHLNYGIALAEQGAIDQAMGQFHEALQIKPGDPKAVFNVGLALARKGDLDGAIRKYQEATTINPNYYLAHFNLGTALAGKGHLDLAIKEFQEAVRIYPGYFEAHNNLGLALASTGRLDEAATAFRNAIKAKSNYFEARYNLGLTLANAGQLAAAANEYQEALKINPDDAETRRNLEMILQQKGVN